MQRLLVACVCTVLLSCPGCSPEFLEEMDAGDLEWELLEQGLVLDDEMDGERVGRSEYLVDWSRESKAGAAPFSLTASDGTGLRLVSLDVRSAVEDPLAFTELRIVFENMEPRTREGRFEITLPSGAAISRFAMKIDGKWQEAEVVEKQKARIVYEDFLHQKKDPALLEKKAGNQFRARVFPIFPHSKKEFIISYSQELENPRSPYRIFLAGLPTMRSFSFDLFLGDTGEQEVLSNIEGAVVEDGHVRLTRHRFDTDRNLEVGLPVRSDSFGRRAGTMTVARVQPKFMAGEDPLESLTVLLDTSASRASQLGQAVGELRALIGSLLERQDRDFPLHIVCFDQGVQTVFSGDASDLESASDEQLMRRRPLGASNMEDALEWLLDFPQGRDRLLIYSDGIFTSGITEPAVLAEIASGLMEVGYRRIDTFVVGDVVDQAGMGELAQALDAKGISIGSDMGVEEAARRMLLTTSGEVLVSVPGANWIWPDRVEGVQSGDGFLVYAELPAQTDMIVELDGDEYDELGVELTESAPMLLERAVVSALVERLTARLSTMDDSEEKDELKERIISLSREYRVLSDLTALLVLETRQDYRRFDIDRNALADILIVGEDGVELLHRSDVVMSGSGSGSGFGYIGFGAGGLLGTGRGGAGHGVGTMGYGILAKTGSYPHALDRRAIRGPRVMSSCAVVRGTMSKKTIQRVVRLRLNEIRGCYRDQLWWKPNLQGRVVVRFVITPRGRVQISKVVESTLNNEKVERCIERKTTAWIFPNPSDGGVIVVNYPFVLTPEGQSIDPGAAAPAQHATTWKWPLGEDPVKAAREAAENETDGGKIDDAVASTDRMPDPVEVDDEDGESEVERDGRPSHVRDEPSARIEEEEEPEPEEIVEEKPHAENAYRGRFAKIKMMLRRGKVDEAVDEAEQWHGESPQNVLGLIALGEVMEASGRDHLAARAYGSIIDVFPSRAEMRRMAAARMEALGNRWLALAIDSYRKAVDQRPDHPGGHQLLAYALLKSGQPKEAYQAIKAGRDYEYPQGRFAGADRILKEDAQLIVAAWLEMKEGEADSILATLRKDRVRAARGRSTRFMLSWETDATDVDIHIYARGWDHAFYSKRQLVSGGELYDDVTTGYGPECFTIKGKPRGYPYRFQAHYYNRGPMGYGMGRLQIIEHDGRGRLSFDERPFVIMRDGAFVNLGKLTRATELLGVEDYQGEKEDLLHDPVTRRLARRSADTRRMPILS